MDIENKTWEASQITKVAQILELMLETQIDIPQSLTLEKDQDLSTLHILLSQNMLQEYVVTDEPIEDLCNGIYHRELEDVLFAYKMSAVRCKIARHLCRTYPQKEISSTCYFNCFLQELMEILAARNLCIKKPLPLSDIGTAISKEEQERVANLMDYVSKIGWENIPFGEREELLLCICYHYYSQKYYGEVSSLVMEVMETGVSNPLIYMAYFCAALGCGEFEAAMEAYNAAISESPSLAILPTDRYSIEGVVATNIFEQIYYGKDSYTEKKILIKLLKTPPRQVIENIKESDKLKHSRIIEILDVRDISPQKTVVVVDSFQGLPLERYIKEIGPLSMEKWQEVAMQILGAVAHAHDFEVAHGYLSPASILFDGAQVKLCNFGFCVGEMWGETINIENMDELSFYAPEVVKGEALSLQSDVYSLGKILCYLLTGNVNDFFNEKIPSNVLNVIAKSLCFCAENRYANAEDLFKNLVEAIENPEKTVHASPKATTSQTQSVNENQVIDSQGRQIVLPDCFRIKNNQIYHKKDGSAMVLVTEGPFTMGSNERNSESPIHEVQLSSYLIDKFPVTNKQYMNFLQETARIDLTQITHRKQTKPNNFKPKGWRTPEYSSFSDLPNSPVIFVDWWDAWAYAMWVGKSLPTEAEWEKAARGNDGRMYPWGKDLPTSTTANFGGNIGKTTPVGTYPESVSPYGCLDMVGNVSEWCYDTYDPNFYSSGNSENPINNADKLSRVVRGGSWNDAITSIRNTVRGCWMNTVRYNFIGFRCVYRLDQNIVCD